MLTSPRSLALMGAGSCGSGHRSVRRLSSGPRRLSLRCAGGVIPPHHPGAFAPRLHAVERNLILERIHRPPEPSPPERHEFARSDQACERLLDQFLALVDVVENVL